MMMSLQVYGGTAGLRAGIHCLVLPSKSCCCKHLSSQRLLIADHACEPCAGQLELGVCSCGHTTMPPCPVQHGKRGGPAVKPLLPLATQPGQMGDRQQCAVQFDMRNDISPALVMRWVRDQLLALIQKQRNADPGKNLGQMRPGFAWSLEPETQVEVTAGGGWRDARSAPGAKMRRQDERVFDRCQLQYLHIIGAASEPYDIAIVAGIEMFEQAPDDCLLVSVIPERPAGDAFAGNGTAGIHGYVHGRCGEDALASNPAAEVRRIDAHRAGMKMLVPIGLGVDIGKFTHVEVP